MGEVTKRKEPKFLKPSALNATLLRLEVLTSRDPTSTVSGDAKVVKLKVSHTLLLTRRVVLLGDKTLYLNTWRTQRNTSKELKWFSPESRNQLKERILLPI